MAILNQIGGISTGGLTGALEGPLSKLFGNKQGLASFQYPSNLGNDPSRMHIVQFEIKNVIPRKFDVEKLAKALASSDVAGTEKNSNVAANGAINVKKVSVTEDLNVILSPETSKTHATINLYMPDTLSMNYNQEYDTVSLVQATGGLARGVEGLAGFAKSFSEGYAEAGVLGGFANALTSPEALVGGAALVEGIADRKGRGIDLKDAVDIALKTQARALNPQIQLLYRGVNLREFSMEFMFTPKSKEEADQVSAIVNTFIYASTPTISGSGGMFFIPPSQFEIKFLMAKTGNFSAFQSMLQRAGNSIVPGLPLGDAVANKLGTNTPDENKRLFKIGSCVLTNVSVDYAPNGWAAHENGAPVQTRLTLQFQEIYLVDRNRLKSGAVR